MPDHEILMAEKRFSVLDHAPIGMCVVRNDYTILFWNRCLANWTQKSPGEIVGIPLTDVVSKFHSTKYTSRLETVFAGGPATIFSSQLHKSLFPAPLPGGKNRILHTTITAVPDQNGQGYYALFSMEDITELDKRIDDYRYLHKQANLEIRRREKAEQANKQIQDRMMQSQKRDSLGLLAGGVAHHFNNLMHATLGNAEMAMKMLSANSSAWKFLTAICDASNQATLLTQQMLAFSGKGLYSHQPLNLNSLLEKMKSLIEVSKQEHIKIEYNLAEKIPKFMADDMQMQQLILSLVANASESIDEENDGGIRIITGVVECDETYMKTMCAEEHLPLGPYVYIKVIDNGCGMDETTQQQMFDPFFTTKFMGRGLGLAVVYGIVRSAQGAIHASSLPGEGSIFTVLFPAMDRRRDNEVAAAEPAKEIKAEKRNSKAVLVADDEELVRLISKHLLESAGYRVFMARDGREAVDMFRTHWHEIQCVVLDLNMPNVGGIQALEEIRALRSDARVILASGYTKKELVGHYHDKDLDGVLEKPYDATSFLSIIREATEK